MCLGESVSGIREGSAVVLSESCTTYDLLKPGDIGVVVKDDRSELPFKVEFKGSTHWYRRDHLKQACNQAGVPVGRGKREYSHLMCVLNNVAFPFFNKICVHVLWSSPWQGCNPGYVSCACCIWVC